MVRMFPSLIDRGALVGVYIVVVACVRPSHFDLSISVVSSHANLIVKPPATQNINTKSLVHEALKAETEALTSRDRGI